MCHLLARRLRIVTRVRRRSPLPALVCIRSRTWASPSRQPLHLLGTSRLAHNVTATHLRLVMARRRMAAGWVSASLRVSATSSLAGEAIANENERELQPVSPVASNADRYPASKRVVYPFFTAQPLTHIDYVLISLYLGRHQSRILGYPYSFASSHVVAGCT